MVDGVTPSPAHRCSDWENQIPPKHRCPVPHKVLSVDLLMYGGFADQSRSKGRQPVLERHHRGFKRRRERRCPRVRPSTSKWCAGRRESRRAMRGSKSDCACKLPRTAPLARRRRGKNKKVVHSMNKTTSAPLNRIWSRSSAKGSNKGHFDSC
jgi:hypothetical protein